MVGWLSRYLSLDDLWSVLGYGFVLVINRFRETPLPLPLASIMAAGMLGIVWLASAGIRARNRDRNPNARVLFWGLVAVVSALVTLV